MRYLLDTNIFIYAVLERDLLDEDVDALLSDYDNQFYLSSESAKELILLFDPSDHIIIAQAITEHIPLVSSDLKFPLYRQQGLNLVLNKK